MRCTNKLLPILVLISVFVLSGCGETKFDMPYTRANTSSSFNITDDSGSMVLNPFAMNLCVADTNVNENAIDTEQIGSAGLFRLNNAETLYAKNVNARLHPASLTKVMTALVALEKSAPDQILTATENVIITEAGAQLCNLKPGDKMTLDQALHILLVYSANDVAMLIAENIAGSIDGFVEMMNQEAKLIGATNCHFSNPHGLTADEHYVSPYDMYLIMNKALQYNLFSEIIQCKSYETSYYDKNGQTVEFSCESTNLFFQNKYETPDNVIVLGGKTGTTNAAGHCLILYSKDSSGNPYVSVVMNAESKDVLYNAMKSVLDLENVN